MRLEAGQVTARTGHAQEKKKMTQAKHTQGPWELGSPGFAMNDGSTLRNDD